MLLFLTLDYLVMLCARLRDIDLTRYAIHLPKGNSFASYFYLLSKYIYKVLIRTFNGCNSVFPIQIFLLEDIGVQIDYFSAVTLLL